jgi:hypothetical protein
VHARNPRFGSDFIEPQKQITRRFPRLAPRAIGCADVRFGILPPGSVCDEATGCPGMTTPGVSLLFALNGALHGAGRTRTVDPAAQSAAG